MTYRTTLLFLGGNCLGILLILLITTECAEVSSEQSVSIQQDLIDDTTVNIVEVVNGTVESKSGSNDNEGLATESAETESNIFLIHAAYAIGCIFGVILFFIAAATILCFLTAAASLTYWIYKGSRRLVRKCFCSKENDWENCQGSLDGNWILRGASSMNPY